ncbi:MAG TPA: DegT/DnrJ/EryC1/StrS family aminotransferase [Candidatus Binatia bacterium]|nr:DegT/DnrJ/EryC1/StrS family aminotransferase [Candidatus Binatia bacterium]
MGNAKPLQFHRAPIGEEEIAEVIDTLRSGWITMGPRTRAFEEAFARAIGARHAVAVNSCTSALHLGLDALGLGPDDEVITSTYTFTATVATILHVRARPVLVDCCDDTLNIDPDDIRRKITPCTRAIVPVHFAGHPAAMDEIGEIAREHELVVFEDAAHALPASFAGRTIGTISPLTAFSFYATKNITTGEGGMLTTDDDGLAERLRPRRLHGMSRDAWRRYTAEGSWRYDVEYPGFKYNMTDINAALGLVQLKKMERFRAARSALAARYDEWFRDVPEVRVPITRSEVSHAWHLYVLRIQPEAAVSRDRLIDELKRSEIGVSQHFIPIHFFSFYQQALGVDCGQFPVATAAGDSTVSLPLYPDLSVDDLDRVAETVCRLVRGQ